MEQDNKHYKGNFTFWKLAKSIYKIDRPEKYCVIFNTWKDIPESFSCTIYDNIDDALSEAKLINNMYTNTPKPTRIYNKDGKYKDGDGWRYDRYDWDFSDGKYFWGYAVLDMINCKFIKIVNGLNNRVNKLSTKPRLIDYDKFFRGENEIDENYLWDIEGEYDGWLQYRWGDGKNAIGYIDPNKKERPGVTETREFYDESIDDYVKRKVRVVYVNWGDPLPKKEKGIYYERPNHEPVIFPGDFGYEGDYNLQPWSLSEELAEDEYWINNGRKFDNDKVGKTTMENILGDNNPLKKLLDK